MKKLILTIAMVVATTSAQYGYSNNDTKNIYKEGKYGLQEKVGELRTDNRGNSAYYEEGKYGLMEKKTEYRKNPYGGTDIYKEGKYGIMEKVGEIK